MELDVPLNCIIVPLQRQRKDLGDIEDLWRSIKARGLLNAIIVEPREDGNYVLVAGERRLAAHTHGKAASIRCRQLSDLSPDERRLIELEENTKRKDLHWSEYAKAINEIHSIKQAEFPDWTVERTSEHMGYSPESKTIKMAVAIGGSLTPELMKANGLEPAYNIINRRMQRQLADIGNIILSTPINPLAPGAPKPKKEASQDIICGDFHEWAKNYSGPKFNLLHCDFPYGIDIGESDQMQHEAADLYEDTEEIYWSLLETLSNSLDSFCHPSAHLIFWFSMKHYIPTLEFLRKRTDFVVQDFPLIWHKSDNAGIVSDHRRRPRNTYETALFASRGDRFIVKPVAGSYAAPTASKRLHASEKPEPVLRHFFQMVVDEGTLIFDPTCGSGSALRTADAMGARKVLGLELNPEYAKAANGALSTARAMRKLSENTK